MVVMQMVFIMTAMYDADDDAGDDYDGDDVDCDAAADDDDDDSNVECFAKPILRLLEGVTDLLTLLLLLFAAASTAAGHG